MKPVPTTNTCFMFFALSKASGASPPASERKLAAWARLVPSGSAAASTTGIWRSRGPWPAYAVTPRSSIATADSRKEVLVGGHVIEVELGV